MAYSEFLGKFPKIDYDINKSLYGSKENVTNIFFRVAFIKKIINNISAYYVYELNDGDTAETLADSVYNDVGLSWMIIYANDIVDPQHDWHKPYDVFRSYLIEKYKSSVATCKLNSITIENGGTGYSNGYISFEGGNGSEANANVTVDALGTITTIHINNAGNTYFINDVVTANVQPLGGENATLIVKLTEPTNQEVLNYTQITPHHYEKVVERNDIYNTNPDVSRYTVNRNILTNGAIYVANTGEFEIGETVFISNSVEPGDSFFRARIDFQGVVEDYSNANGCLILSNTTGRLVLYNDIKGNNSGHMATVLRTSFDDRPYEYFDNMANFQYVQTIDFNDSGYTVTQVTHSDVISLYDWEDEVNESRRWIKIIKPTYVADIQTEFRKFIDDYSKSGRKRADLLTPETKILRRLND